MPVRLARCLGATLLVAALTLSAWGQSSVTLAWDAETGGAVAGYRLYDGVASRTYTNVIVTGTATTITVAGLTAGMTYYFAVTAVGTNGLESDYSTEMSYPVPLPTNNPPTIALTFAADSGTFTAPFVDSAGTLSQSVATGLSNGGQAVYAFNIPTTGNYLVSAMVIAPSQSQNSLYVNIDAPPTDPLMIWDVPVSSTLTNATVSWRGNGNGDPASSQYNPKVFNLSAGTHQLIIIGREANTTLGAISIAAATPRLRIGRRSAGTGGRTGSVLPSQTPMTLGANGAPGQTYSVLSSQDLVNWTVIGTITLDATGSGQFTDPANATLPHSFYRLQGQ